MRQILVFVLAAFTSIQISAQADCQSIEMDCMDNIVNSAELFFDNLCSDYWQGECSSQSPIYTGNIVTIGTQSLPTNLAFRLVVSGGIMTDQLRLCRNVPWCDYVFDPTYELMSLTKVEDHIEEFGHLPGCTSQEEINKRNSVPLGEIIYEQQEKIEEIYLHLLNMDERIAKLENSSK